MELDSTKRFQLNVGVVFAIACVVYLIIVFVFNIDTEVMFGRFENANDVFNGKVPDMEYPPFALVFMLIPRLFASTPYWYNVGFVIELFLFFMAGLIITCKIAEKLGKDQKKAMLLYTALMLLMFEFVVDRYDIIPAVLTMLSVYCYMTKRYDLAFILLSLGTMTKLYPAILFPIFIIPFIMDRDWKRLLRGTVVFAAASLAVVIPIMLVQPDMLSYFIEYHADRPLQIESVAASFIYPLAMLGLTDVWIEFGYGSDNLMGSLPDAVASLLTPLMIASIVIVYILFAYALKRSKENSEDATGNLFLFGWTMTMSIALFIVVGKVFSSQYIIWLIPPILFIIMLMKDHLAKKRMLLLTVVSIIITQLDFIYNIGYLGGGANINDLGMMIILARNVVMIILVYYISKEARAHFVKSSRIVQSGQMTD